jgi:hypothetical protein
MFVVVPFLLLSLEADLPTNRFVQESRNNVENTLRAKTKEASDEVSVLEKKAKVRFPLLILSTRYRLVPALETYSPPSHSTIVP